MNTYFVGLAIAGMLSTSQASGESLQCDGDAMRTTLSNYTAAYNERNGTSMSEFWADDIVWAYYDAGAVYQEANGIDAARASLDKYFSEAPETHSVLSDIVINGCWASGVETVVWQTESGSEKSQAAMVVYRFTDRKIAEVIYFPASKR